MPSDCRRETGSSWTAGPSPLSASCTVDGWTIGHGHQPMVGDRTISGHLHPVFRAAGVGSPCFLVGPGRIVLPASSPNAVGFDVVTARVPREWLKIPLCCLVSTGDELLSISAPCPTSGAGCSGSQPDTIERSSRTERL
jgi:hypothetical protein